MRIYAWLLLFAVYCSHAVHAADVGGSEGLDEPGDKAGDKAESPGAEKSGSGDVMTSKLPTFPLNTLFASVTAHDKDPAGGGSAAAVAVAGAAAGGTQKMIRVPKNLVRTLREAMEATRQKQETLIAHLECSLSSASADVCEALRPPEVKLDWTTYVADDQTPYLLEISHFFRENPTDFPIEIVAPIMQMFNGATTEVYIKQRYISSLFEQAVCSISQSCEKPKPTKRPSLKDEDRDRIFPSVYDWFTNLFQPSFQPLKPVFTPPSSFAHLKPCRNETISGTFNRGQGFYYSAVVEYDKNCTQFQHNSSSVHN